MARIGNRNRYAAGQRLGYGDTESFLTAWQAKTGRLFQGGDLRRTIEPACHVYPRLKPVLTNTLPKIFFRTTIGTRDNQIHIREQGGNTTKGIGKYIKTFLVVQPRQKKYVGPFRQSATPVWLLFCGKISCGGPGAQSPRQQA